MAKLIGVVIALAVALAPKAEEPWLAKATPRCSSGAVTSVCRCGGPRAYSGYCCYGSTQSTPCKLFEDDGTETFHVWFNGTAFQDTKSVAWAEQGTVPQVAASGSIPAGCGPTTTSNYYRPPSVNGVTDFPGDYMCCVAFYFPTTIASDSYMVSDYSGSFSGWYMRVPAASKVAQIYVGNGSTLPNASTANTIRESGVLNVMCAGKTGTTLVSKLNLGAMASTTGAGTTSVGTAYYGRIGGTTSAGFAGVIVEARCAPTTPTDEKMTSVMSNAKMVAGVTAW